MTTRRPQYLPVVWAEQVNHGRQPPKWQLVQVTGTRCSIGFHPAARKLRARYISTTASTSLRTLIVPDGSPPLPNDHENWWPACSRPSRCQRRTSIDLYNSHMSRPPNGHRDNFTSIERSIHLHFGGCAAISLLAASARARQSKGGAPSEGAEGAARSWWFGGVDDRRSCWAAKCQPRRSPFLRPSPPPPSAKEHRTNRQRNPSN
jgi:hypothetical protein